MGSALRSKVAVTAGLSAIGVVCGVVLGSIAFWTELALLPGRSDPADYVNLAFVGALGGALFGAVLAPVVGWIFLRRVSFARAIAETSAGIAIGIVVGAVINPRHIILSALGGFVLAGARLWWETRSFATTPHGHHHHRVT